MPRPRRLRGIGCLYICKTQTFHEEKMSSTMCRLHENEIKKRQNVKMLITLEEQAYGLHGRLYLRKTQTFHEGKMCPRMRRLHANDNYKRRNVVMLVALE